MSCSCTVRTFEPKIFRKKSTSSPQHTLEDYCKSKLLYIKQPVKFLQNIYSSTTHLTRIPFVFLRGCRLYEISRPEDEKAFKKKKKVRWNILSDNSKQIEKGRRVHYISAWQSPQKAPSCLQLVTQEQSTNHTKHFQWKNFKNWVMHLQSSAFLRPFLLCLYESPQFYG